MLIALAIGICVLLAILGFLVPALSKSQHGAAADRRHKGGKDARAKLPF